MMELQPISPLRPLQAESAGAVGEMKTQPTMFADIFRSMVDNVRQTDAAKTQAEYALATGELDNPGGGHCGGHAGGAVPLAFGADAQQGAGCL